MDFQSWHCGSRDWQLPEACCPAKLTYLVSSQVMLLSQNLTDNTQGMTSKALHTYKHATEHTYTHKRQSLVVSQLSFCTHGSACFQVHKVQFPLEYLTKKREEKTPHMAVHYSKQPRWLTRAVEETYVLVFQLVVGVWLPTSLDLTLHYHPS